MAGAKRKKIKIEGEYKTRLNHELKLIEEKGFQDYFFVLADMITEAKKTMLVGPSRGSSAGSLVCYLTSITEVDPIVHDLMFERFIDVTRADLPDIDVDFPHIQRDETLAYLGRKYGAENVARIGTISRYKPKSAITDFAKEFGIPAWETFPVKNAIIERSSGDARAAFCIADTFETLDVGQAFIKKYPEMMAVAKIEHHARHHGKHAAGVFICNEPISHYCGVDVRDGVAQLDKYAAESLNMLKIDALGLRTLTVLQESAELAGLDRLHFYDLPLDDKKVYAPKGVFNTFRLAGIFQFEGYALQTLSKQMGVKNFDDIVAITSLARPGPLHSGGATDFVERRTGRAKITLSHPSLKPYVKDTYGVVVFQEQVMEISRHIGKLSWEDVSALRKAISKSLGDEFFGQYWEKFEAGALENKLTSQQARSIWENIMTFGSWAFNKSHGVSYGLISYWCAWMKTHYPLEFAVGCLNNAKDDDQVVKLLRELRKEGFEFIPWDLKRSDSTRWVTADNTLLGPVVNVRGIGPKKAQEIQKKASTGVPLPAGLQKLVDKAQTPYDDIFEGQRKFGHIYKDPKAHNVLSGPISFIKDIQEDGEYIFIAKIRDLNLRDLNEYQSLVNRGGKVIERNNLFLNMNLEDDTDMIICSISRHKYSYMGKPLVEAGKTGAWYLIKGTIRGGWRKVNIDRMKKLEE